MRNEKENKAKSKERVLEDGLLSDDQTFAVGAHASRRDRGNRGMRRITEHVLHSNSHDHSDKSADVHSQGIIITALSQLQNEICLKFFRTSPDFKASVNDKILYINNPDQRKTCTSNLYNFSKTIVDMPIGYKCINQRDIASIVMEMLRASIGSSGSSVNSYDLLKRFEEKNSETVKSTLLSARERDFINSHYLSECSFVSPPMQPTVQRRSGKDSSDSLQLSDANLKFYNEKLWPLAVVLYAVADELKNTEDFKILRNAMTTIELSTCVVFQEVSDDVLLPKSIIWLVKSGEDIPKFGFVHGNQTLNLSSVANGAPAHTAHAINNLLRILGVPMMSNRYDRDNYVIINWRNVEMGKEQYLEKMSEESWIVQIPYDFDSATHAPANYMCGNCELGGSTVQPIQDNLWQRTLIMGHTEELSPFDVKLINILYNKECNARYMPNR